MIWLAFALQIISFGTKSINPSYITGFISDMSQFKGKRIISNYVNVTEENTYNSGDVKYLVTGQSSTFRTIVAEDWSGYIDAQKSKDNCVLFYHRDSVSMAKPDLAPEEENEENIMKMDVNITLKVSPSAKMRIVRNVSFIEDKNKVDIYNLLVSEDGSSVSTPNIIKLPTGEYQVSCSPKHVFAVYKDEQNLVVHNLSSNETIKTMSIGSDFTILKINSETYSNYVVTIQGTDMVTYELQFTEIEETPEEEEEHQEEIEENEETTPEETEETEETPVTKPGVSEVTIRKVDTKSLLDYLDTFGLVLDNIPLSKILGMSRVILFEEDYIGFYSAYQEQSLFSLSSTKLVLYSPKLRKNQVFLIPTDAPMGLYSNSYNMLYASGRFSTQNSQMAAYDLEGLLTAPKKLANENDNCWVDETNWNKTHDMSGVIRVTLKSTENCTLQKVDMYYKDYYESTEFLYDESTLTYSVTPSSSFRQLGYDIIIKDIPGKSEDNKLVSSKVYPQSNEIPSCYSQGGSTTVSLKDNIITLSVKFNIESDCAVDTPTINAYVKFNGEEYRQEMTQTTLTNPFTGASYEVLFDPTAYPGLSGDNIECNFEVISYSPSGYEIAKQNLTAMLSD